MKNIDLIMPKRNLQWGKEGRDGKKEGVQKEGRKGWRGEGGKEKKANWSWIDYFF